MRPAVLVEALRSARSAQLAVQAACNSPELDRAVSGAVSRSLTAIVTTVMAASLGILAFLALAAGFRDPVRVLRSP